MHRDTLLIECHGAPCHNGYCYFNELTTSMQNQARPSAGKFREKTIWGLSRDCSGPAVDKRITHEFESRVRVLLAYLVRTRVQHTLAR